MNSRSATFAGIALVVLTLLALAFFPRFFQDRKFVLLDPPQRNSNPTPLSLTTEFTQLEVSPERKVTEGRKISMGKLLEESGRTTLLLNFWATWCPPCVDELPSLENLSRQVNATKDKSHPLVVTISVDEQLQDIATLFKTLDFRAGFIVLRDPTGEFAAKVGTTKFPETYWLDSQGIPMFKWLGPQDWLSSDVIHRLAFKASR